MYSCVLHYSLAKSLFSLSLCSAVQTSPSSSGGVFSGGSGQLPGRPLGGGGGGGILGNGK